MLNLPSFFIEHQPRVEAALREALTLPSAKDLPLYQMMRYQLGWENRDGSETDSAIPFRELGTICLEAALLGKSPERAKMAAASIELFSHAVAVHEDMEHADPHSEERPSVWWIWGPAQAINVGDGLHALARLAVLELGNYGLQPSETLKLMQIFDSTALHFYEGQYMELTYQERIDVTELQYVRFTEAKYGSRIGGAIALGAQASGCDEETVKILRIFGSRLGLAAQLLKDISEIWPPSNNRNISFVLLNKNKLFPVVYAWEKASLPEKRSLGEVYFKRFLDPSDIDNIREFLDNIGAKEYTLQTAQKIITEATSLLSGLNITDAAKNRWSEFANGLSSG